MDIKNKVILISNRNVNPKNTDTSLFGDDLTAIEKNILSPSSGLDAAIQEPDGVGVAKHSNRRCSAN